MENTDQQAIRDKTRSRHLRVTEPSPWVRRFQSLIPRQGPSGGAVLDLAAGGGRHARFLKGLGFTVTAVDRDTSALGDLAADGVEIIEVDLEAGMETGTETGANVFEEGGALAGRVFAGICVVNYLHRPLMAAMIAALEPGGVLIYETFARGNEDFVRPRNPDHLLKSGELLELVRGRLQVIAYEHGIIKAADIEGVKQRICAVNDLGASEREDGEPAPHPVSQND